MSSESGSDAYDLELYKSLRHEAASYLEKIPAVWIQKLIFAGAILAFVVSKPVEAPALAERADDFMIAAFVCVPLLAMLLDVKIFEYSIHARTISRFIAVEFEHIPRVVAWESTLWAEGSDPHLTDLARYRSIATVAVTLLSTAAVIVLSGVVIGDLTDRMGPVVAFAVFAAVAYVAIGMWSVVVVWPRLGRTQ